jgi:ribosomal protein L10
MKAAIAHKMAKPEEGDEDYETRKDTWKECDELEKISNLLKGNVGLIFSNGDLGEVKKVLDD